MPLDRRELLTKTAIAAAASFGGRPLQGAAQKLGIPGPFRGRVVAVQSDSSIVSGTYQPETIQKMMHKGMVELTGAPGWPDAWKVFFEPGDVVGIKVSPVGGRNLCSDASVMRPIVEGLQAAGVKLRDIVVFNRYRREMMDAGIHRWAPDGVRTGWASEAYSEFQLDMDGYDRDVFMEMALLRPGDDPNDAHFRRSYVAKIVTQQVNKIINMTVLKHHQSAGVTIALKNMSHGFVNNVNRSHVSPIANACGSFIPSVVSLPVIRQKAVLHICDGVKASFHGGPGGRPKYIWEHKTMYFASDPVAMDKIGLKVIDEKRVASGMARLIEAKPDQDSHFWHSQIEHIDIAGLLGLGEADEAKIDLKKLTA